jgi:thymidylate synthase (FAD)
VTETPEFYIPGYGEWRTAPDNRKQGSGEPLPHIPAMVWALGGTEVDGNYGNLWTHLLENYCNDGVKLYEQAMEAGICAEQARLFLPAYGLYVRWRWTASLGAVIHFLQQRLEHDAQKEIQLYSEAVRNLLAVHFPVTVGATVGA